MCRYLGLGVEKRPFSREDALPEDLLPMQEYLWDQGVSLPLHAQPQATGSPLTALAHRNKQPFLLWQCPLTQSSVRRRSLGLARPATYFLASLPISMLDQIPPTLLAITPSL
jgi:hypothetical protein